LVPLIELLLLLLFLLRAPLLHRRRGPDQRMCLLRSRPVHGLRSAIFLRLDVPVIRLVHISIFRLMHRSVLGLRSSLLLVDSRLSLRHLLNLTAPAIGLRERPEAILGLLRPSHLARWGGLRGTRRTNQCLLVQMSACLRLPLLNRMRRRRRRPDRNHWTADDR
jgi:hypothetical protein